MLKCGACGKFLAINDGIKCTKCPVFYHRVCVNLGPTVSSSAKWMCPGCKAKVPRTDNSHTPVKGIDELSSSSVQAAVARSDNTSDKISDTEGISLAVEIRCLRSEVNALRDELRQFRDEFSGLDDKMNKCCNRMDTLEERVKEIEENMDSSGSPRLVQLEETIGELQQQLNEREQESLMNDVQLSGVVESSGENSAQLIGTLALKLGIRLEEQDIVFAKRVGNVRRDHTEGEKLRPRIIVVRLSRRAVRDDLLSAVRVRRNLTTADIGVPGTPRRIYLNERLTKTNRQLFYNTRQAAIRLEWKYTWTKDGRILARKEEGKPVVHVRTERDISRFFVTK
ncbi:hypothetical protein PYW08_006581 [Mythimna loreyi]|uniref:Uncharacterized protein n=1 Tax=Mythimna loreyi TaxID=667449 RepID=A0ACC2QP44_9NEOP|nr:hypothetical protein PYW08_006581 [Mythimna loreyi]